MPVTERVSATIKRYGDADAFLRRMSPSAQTYAARNIERTFMGTAPTLNIVRAAYSDEVAELWLMAQVENMNDFCGVSRKMSVPQMRELARMLLVDAHYLKTSELMLFFHRFKAGVYGEFFGVVDPQRVMAGLQEFLSDRRAELDRLQREAAGRERDRKDEISRARAITYAEYCQMKVSEAAGRTATAATV